MTVNDIMTAVDQDMRQQIGTTTSFAQTAYIDWTDRIHKDMLHSSTYSFLNHATANIVTVATQPGYTLAPTPGIRRIISIYDRTRQRIMFDLDRATMPVPQAEKVEPVQAPQQAPQFALPAQSPLQLQWTQPQFYRHISGTNQILLYPTPGQALTLEVVYEQQVADLSNLTDTLVLPDDCRDAVVAGVNMLANLFLKRSEEAQFWMQLYNQAKMGIMLV